MNKFLSVMVVFLALVLTLTAEAHNNYVEPVFLGSKVVADDVAVAGNQAQPKLKDEDLDLLIVIVHGVAFDKTEPSEETRRYVWDLLNRNGVFTSKQVSYIGEEFIGALSGVLNHSSCFLKDALKTLEIKKATHSPERQAYEYAMLESGEIKPDFIERTVDTIDKIAAGKIVVVPQLGPMTKTNITFLLDSINTAEERIRSLFTLSLKPI